MKKIILSACIMAFAFVSCKKDDDGPTTCEVSVTGIAASYKITKILGITAAGTVDATSTFLDACSLAGVYQLKSDKTIVYTETGASCTGSDTGNWDIVSGKLNASSGDLNVSSATVANNCSNVIVTQDLGSGSSLEYTLTKQ